MTTTTQRLHFRRAFASFGGLLVLILGVTLLQAACDDDLEEAPSGQNITGTITYAGSAHADFAEPIVTVAAFVTFPPTGPPHASTTLEDPDLVNGAAYELSFLEPDDYFVVASVEDRTQPDLAPVPTGGYPDYCSVTGTVGNVTITETDGQSGIDIELFDSGGAADPCNSGPSDICPEANLASLMLTVDADIAPEDIEDNDVVIWAQFSEWPPAGAPTAFALRSSDQIEFPMDIIFNQIPAGAQAIYVCYDAGGDNLGGLCGDEDTEFVYADGELVDFEVGTITALDVDLSAGTSTDVELLNPADFDCEIDTPTGPGSVALTITSESITIGEEDRLTASLFREFPPAGPPAYFDLEPLAEFPAALLIEEVPEGDYYLAACYDAGGGDSSCDGAGDILLWYMDGTEALTIPADTEVPVTMALETSPGSVALTIESTTLTAGEDDRLTASLFTAFPPAGPPAYFDIVDLTAFPGELLIEDVPAGDYYLAACYDMGGGDSSCDGEGDYLVWYMDGSEALTVPNGAEVEVSITVGPPANSVTVNVLSDDLTPEAGDLIVVSLFPGFPPAGPPTDFGSVDAEFPVAVLIEDVAAGEHVVAACFDAGGDDTSCDGEGDVLVFYQGGAATIDLAEDGAVVIDIDLDPAD